MLLSKALFESKPLFDLALLSTIHHYINVVRHPYIHNYTRCY